jgi:hypothetical protein
MIRHRLSIEYLFSFAMITAIQMFSISFTMAYSAISDFLFDLLNLLHSSHCNVISSQVAN